MNTWATRIKERMKELNITQEKLAEKMGITRGAITHYLAGRRVPPLKQFQKLAAILKADPAWLQFGSTSPAKSKIPAGGTKKEKIAVAKDPIPILSWEQVTKYLDISQLDQDEVKEFIPHFYTDKPRWYGLRIKGDSMTASLSQRNSFYEGDLIVVDPDKAVTSGSYVIALLPRSKEATFKQYVLDGGVRYLKPLNQQYPIVKIDDNTHICGVVTNYIKLT